MVQIRDDIKTDTKQMIDTLAKIIQLKEKYKALWENNAVRTEIRENAAQMYPETTELYLVLIIVF